MIQKRKIGDSYDEQSNNAVFHSSHARGAFGHLEQDLNALAWALHDIEKLATAYKPEKIGPMSTFSPGEDRSDPGEHLQILKGRLRQVRSNLLGAKHDIAELESRYERLLAE